MHEKGKRSSILFQIFIVLVVYILLSILIHFSEDKRRLQRYKKASADMGLDEILDSVNCSSATDTDSSLNSRLRYYFSNEAVTARASRNTFKNWSSFSSPKFKIAFSHQVHDQIGLLEIFLRLYFRPHNYHCIHVDTKAPLLVQNTVKALIDFYQKTFDTSSIFILDDAVPVYYIHYSILEADLRCLKALYNRFEDWTYFMNLAGTELPSKPYEDFIAGISEYAKLGRDIIYSFLKTDLHKWLKTRVEIQMSSWIRGPEVKVYFNKPIPKIPFNWTIFKGLKNSLITRKTCKFLLEDPVSLKFRKWLEDKISAEEYFYATLGRITRQDNSTYQNTSKFLFPPVCTRFTIWTNLETNFCNGTIRHNICQLSMADLDYVKKTNCIVINKFNLEIHPVAAVCIAKHVLKS